MVTAPLVIWFCLYRFISICLSDCELSHQSLSFPALLKLLKHVNFSNKEIDESVAVILSQWQTACVYFCVACLLIEAFTSCERKEKKLKRKNNNFVLFFFPHEVSGLQRNQMATKTCHFNIRGGKAFVAGMHPMCSLWFRGVFIYKASWERDDS